MNVLDINLILSICVIFLLVLILTYLFKKLKIEVFNFQNKLANQIDTNLQLYISASSQVTNKKSETLQKDFQKINNDQILQLESSQAINQNLKEMIKKIENLNKNIDKKNVLENEIIKLKKIINRKNKGV